MFTGTHSSAGQGKADHMTQLMRSLSCTPLSSGPWDNGKRYVKRSNARQTSFDSTACTGEQATSALCKSWV